MHDIKGYFINIRVLFNYLATIDTPVVWTIHSCWQFTGHCGYFDLLGCNRWKNGCYDCPGKNKYPRSWLLDRSHKNWQEKKSLFTNVRNLTLVPVSYWLSNLLADSFLKGIPRQVIYNGVNTSVFRPMVDFGFLDKYQLNGKKVLVAAATSWEERKGLFDYIRLRELLASDYVIVLIGLNKEQIKKLPIGVVGVERINDQTEMARWYSVADVVLNLSYEETFGLTTVEGLSCGTPCVVYNKAASPELISAGVGEVVEGGNIDAVAEAVKRVEGAKSKEEYRRICRQHVIDKFNKEKNFGDYISLYERLMKK